MDSDPSSSGLALMLLGLYWAGMLVALRVYHLPNFPLIWALGMVPALLAARSFSALTEMSILCCPGCSWMGRVSTSPPHCIFR